jgi:hypothetical protein
MADELDAADRVRGVHFAHCYQGEYRHVCKYGESDCPAAVVDEPDRPDDADLDPEERALALVRYLALSTSQQELEQARTWACQIALEMEN